MIIELAAMPQSVTEAFAKALYVILLAAMKEKGASSESINGLKKWAPAAMPLVNRFKLTGFVKVYKEVVKTGKVEDQEALVEFGKEIKKSFDAMHSEHDIKIAHLDIIKYAGKWFRNQSEPSYRKLERAVSGLSEKVLNAEFVKEIGSQVPLEKALKKVVKALVGKDDTIIMIPDLPKAQKKKDIYKEYLRLRKQYNLVWREALSTYVRQSGKQTIPYEDALKFLKSKGIKHTMHPDFKGRIDDQGRLYTVKGLMINGVPSPLLPYMKMNPDYDPDKDNGWVMFASKWPPGGPKGQRKGTHYYTVSYRKDATKEKFVNVDELRDKIEGIRKVWLPFMKAGVENPRGVAATILEILYEYSARVGATPTKPNGISTLLVKNVKVTPQGVILKYAGKDQVIQQHAISKKDPLQKFIVANILDLMKGKKPTDHLFTAKKKNGKFVHINAVMVNKFFSKLGAGNVTVHKLRTLRGTIIFQEEMKKLKLETKKGKTSEAQAKKLFIEIAEKVGEQLGHVRTMKGQQKVTGMTAIGSYIDPQPMLEFWQKLGLRPPKFLAKFEG
jgi:hypothetical protein